MRPCFHRLPFDLWPLSGDTDIGSRGWAGWMTRTPRCRSSCSSHATSPAYRCRHSYFIADNNTRCLRLDSRSPRAVVVVLSTSRFVHRWVGDGRTGGVSMTDIGFSWFKRAVIGYRLSLMCAVQSCHCWIIVHHWLLMST